MAPIDVGLLGTDGILHRPDGPGLGLQERKPLGCAGERETLREPSGWGLRTSDRRMIAFERAPTGLPPVPVDRLAGGTLSQIDEQQLQGIDQLPKRQSASGAWADTSCKYPTISSTVTCDKEAGRRAFRNPSTRRTYQGRIFSGTPRRARRSR